MSSVPIFGFIQKTTPCSFSQRTFFWSYGGCINRGRLNVFVAEPALHHRQADVLHSRLHTKGVAERLRFRNKCRGRCLSHQQFDPSPGRCAAPGPQTLPHLGGVALRFPKVMHAVEEQEEFMWYWHRACRSNRNLLPSTLLQGAKIDGEVGFIYALGRKRQSFGKTRAVSARTAQKLPVGPLTSRQACRNRARSADARYLRWPRASKSECSIALFFAFQDSQRPSFRIDLPKRFETKPPKVFQQFLRASKVKQLHSAT